MTRLLPRIALVALAGLFLFLLQGAFANATSTPPGCTLYTSHSGHLPDRYDYGIFIEYSPPVEITATTSQDPRDYNAGSRWDVVLKCKTPATTTTTVTDTTSTTSTTSPPATTTTVPDTTTTVPPTTTSSSTTTTAPTTTSSTSTLPPTTTTSSSTTTSSTVPPTTTTLPCDQTDPPTCLPATGNSETLMLVALVGLLTVVLGAAALYGSSKMR